MQSAQFFFIVGCQKCGTTYLHDCLVRTGIFSPGPQKEMNLFSKEKRIVAERYNQYLADFENNKTSVNAKFFLDSSTSYFQLPHGRADTAKTLAETCPDSCQIVLFRNPIERYESAYNHHILWNRLPLKESIDTVDSAHNMLSLGDYCEILQYWKKYFPNIKSYFYDDLLASPVDFVNRILSDHDINYIISKEELDFRSNDSTIKLRKRGLAADKLRLTPEARKALIAYYKSSIEKLEEIMGKNLDHWLIE